MFYSVLKCLGQVLKPQGGHHLSPDDEYLLTAGRYSPREQRREGQYSPHGEQQQPGYGRPAVYGYPQPQPQQPVLHPQPAGD